jgi:hypothetical protein
MNLVCHGHVFRQVFYFILLEEPFQFKSLESWYSSENGKKFNARKSAILVDVDELEMRERA